jgi:hypothetical protein
VDQLNHTLLRRAGLSLLGSAACFVMSIVAAWSHAGLPMLALVLGASVLFSLFARWLVDWVYEFTGKQEQPKRSRALFWLHNAQLGLTALSGYGMYAAFWVHRPVYAGVFAGIPIAGFIISLHWLNQRNPREGGIQR